MQFKGTEKIFVLQLCRASLSERFFYYNCFTNQGNSVMSSESKQFNSFWALDRQSRV